MPVWFENDAPNTSSRSASFISQLATGVPLRPSTPQASGWSSAIWPLALNVVMHRAPSRSASAITASMSNAGTVADDDHRTLRRRASSAIARSTGSPGGAICASGDRPLGRRPPRRLAGQRLHLVGKHEVGDAPLHERVLAGERHQLGVVGVRAAPSGESGDVGERGGEVEVLEGAAAQHLDGT